MSLLSLLLMQLMLYLKSILVIIEYIITNMSNLRIIKHYTQITVTRIEK
jgi:hypothetical protein